VKTLPAGRLGEECPSASLRDQKVRKLK